MLNYDYEKRLKAEESYKIIEDIQLDIAHYIEILEN
jgi:hypothetical protein